MSGEWMDKWMDGWMDGGCVQWVGVGVLFSGYVFLRVHVRVCVCVCCLGMVYRPAARVSQADGWKNG